MICLSKFKLSYTPNVIKIHIEYEVFLMLKHPHSIGEYSNKHLSVENCISKRTFLFKCSLDLLAKIENQSFENSVGQ